MTTVAKPNLIPPGPVPAWTGPAAWVPIVHYLLAVIAGGLAAAHSTFHLTATDQAIALAAAPLLAIAGTLVYFLERKASLASMAAYLRSVVPDILAVIDDAKGAFPAVADRIVQIEADVARFAPTVHVVQDFVSGMVPGPAAATGATPATPLPVTPVAPPVAPPAPPAPPVPPAAAPAPTVPPAA